MVVGSGITSTQDEIAASISITYRFNTYAVKHESLEQYNRHLDLGIEWKPNIFLDDGAIYMDRYISKYRNTNVFENCIGCVEQTTSDIMIEREIHDALGLPYAVININDTHSKSLMDNRWGTGQSVVTGLITATNMQMQGASVCVIGYGRVGSNIALQLKGYGANITIVEQNPFKALEAYLDGYQVSHIEQAISSADIVISATGVHNTIGEREICLMRKGCIIANAGHDKHDVDMEYLVRNSVSIKAVDIYNERYQLSGNKSVYLLCNGGVVNLGVAHGNPATVMDVSFGCSFFAIKHLVECNGALPPGIYDLPVEMDREVTSMKLRYLMDEQE